MSATPRGAAGAGSVQDKSGELMNGTAKEELFTWLWAAPGKPYPAPIHSTHTLFNALLSPQTSIQLEPGDKLTQTFA